MKDNSKILYVLSSHCDYEEYYDIVGVYDNKEIVEKILTDYPSYNVHEVKLNDATEFYSNLVDGYKYYLGKVRLLFGGDIKYSVNVLDRPSSYRQGYLYYYRLGKQNWYNLTMHIKAKNEDESKKILRTKYQQLIIENKEVREDGIQVIKKQCK